MSCYLVYDRYDIPAKDDVMGKGLGCVLRAKYGALRKEDVQVKVLDPMDAFPPLDSTEEILSNILMITLSGGHTGQFEVNHNLPRGHRPPYPHARESSRKEAH